ncbi:MAG: 50S ribosomal protein L25 [Sphaerochaetaceae bacterium]|nr:50S ribosomal protein L25 [Sphaerochaetaceae bacterium]MDC7238031.1 50S ribosomal protein L25 [Sphaerochaetaceae bacterium]MDC7243145.1 50S ribosomal protein L25 [Sphaerochaetaceae bacterium]
MSNHVFDATLRTSDFGSAGSRRLLRAGKIPAVIYGSKTKPMHIVIDAHKFALAIGSISESTLITLNVEGDEHEVLVKTFQEDIMTDIIHHVDFYEVVRGEKLRAFVSLSVEGNPVGCKKGGILDVVLHEVEVECLPKDLPADIKVDVSALDLNDHISVKELPVAKTVSILTDGDETVATVKSVKVEKVATEEEEVVATEE